MNYSLVQIKNALTAFGVGGEQIDNAIMHLCELLKELDDVEVKGRKNLDTLLGCMMAIEAIIGGDANG